jgi:cysteine desulfurase/selenocysteine lyase
MSEITANARSGDDTFHAFRAGFPALNRLTYLSICDKAILHDAVRAAVDVFLDRLAMASANRVDHERQALSAKAKFARLTRVADPTIAAIRNVSDGANSIAWAMPWRNGDNVVLTADAEHPNNIYPWLSLKRRDIDVRLVPAGPDGQVDVGSLIAAMDGRTRVVAAASVTFAPGHRTDLRRLGDVCARRDVLLFVDGVQSAGILRHDLAAEQVGAFATSTSKGLLGLYGFGFLYISPDWVGRLEPAYLSRPAVAQLADDHSVMGGLDYEYQPDSRRFELGSFNLAGAYAADRALDLLLDLGPEAIEARVLGLSTMLNEALREAGLAPAVPGGGPSQSHIVTVGDLDAGGHGFSSNPLIGPLSAHLASQDIVHTIRRGQMRFALHAFNDERDIEHTAAAIREGLKTARARS